MLLTNEEEARYFIAANCEGADYKRLEDFAEILVLENENQNLIAHSTTATVWLRHLADSAQLLSWATPERKTPWLDLGTGAGFPGIVIAIMRPAWEVVLVESRGLRIRWLTEVVECLSIENVRIVGADIRNVPSFPAATISARAFAPLARLIALAARFSTNETMWLLPKGLSAAQEIEMLPTPLQPMFHVKPSLTDRLAGIIIGHGRIKPVQ